MRVTCSSVEEFIENLKVAKEVHQKTLYVSLFKRPCEGTKATASKFDVVFQASTIVITPIDDEEWQEHLLEVGVDCGRDYPHEGNNEGSEIAHGLRNILAEYATSREWHILPGVVGY